MYGLKQTAMSSWREFYEKYKMNHKFIDPCMYNLWNKDGLSIAQNIMGVDDCMILGSKDNVENNKKQLQERRESNHVGKIKEFVGCKEEQNTINKSIKLTQALIIQIVKDKFGACEKECNAPATLGGSQDQVTNKTEKEDFGQESVSYCV
jgi:hypothetical protein